MKCRPGDLVMVVGSHTNSGRFGTVVRWCGPEEHRLRMHGYRATNKEAGWLVQAQSSFRIRSPRVGQVDVPDMVFPDSKLLPIRPPAAEDETAHDLELTA